MTRTCTALTIIFMVAHLTQAQPPQTVWMNIYGGTASDLAYDCQTTADGGFIFAGESASFSFETNDIYVIRTDENGDTLWTHTYGGDQTEGAATIRPTNDGGWIICAGTSSFGAGQYDMYLVKIDSVGAQQWQHTYGGTGIEFATAAEQTSDGGYIICGFVRPTVFAANNARIVKTDSVGTEVWTRTFGTTQNQEVFYDVHQLPNHGYVLCGFNDDFDGNGGWDMWAVLTDSAGNDTTSRLYGGMGDEIAYAIIPTDDGGFALAGNTDRDFTIAQDFYLVKTDANLDTTWTRNWGRVFLDEAFDLIQTTDHGYLMTGHTCIPFGGDCRYDMFLVKTDANGDTLWTAAYGDDQNDGAYATRQTADGGYIIAGYNTSPDIIDYDFFVIRLEGGACPDFTPRAPEQLTIQSIGDDIELRWNPVTVSVADCPLTNVSYSIFSDDNSGGSFPNFVGTTADTTFTDVDGNLGDDQKFYRVTAITP